MQATSPSLRVLNPTNWSPKCQQTALLAIIATVALGAIYYLASSERKAWLRCQFMSEESARIRLKEAVNDDPVMAKAILDVFCKAKEVIETLLNNKEALPKDVAHPMWLCLFMSEESACIKFTKAMKNDDPVMAKAIFDVFGKSKKVTDCLFYYKEQLPKAPNVVKAIWPCQAFKSLFNDDKIELKCFMECAASNDDIGLDEWKMPFDDKGNTVLHRELIYFQYHDWIGNLLKKPFAADLLQVKNKEGVSPLCGLLEEPEELSKFITEYNFPVEVWKGPIDEEGNTVLHIVFKRMAEEVREEEWEKVAAILLQKEFAVQLLGVEAKNDESPLDVFNGMSSGSIKVKFTNLLRQANEENRVSTEVLQMLGIDTTEMKNVSGESPAEGLPI
ncbi:MAG: hypothetical protein H7A40_03270 [Chlamydiales bacterium]|nr:hypothetical protein [Chlamydiales bacterium]